MNDLLFIKKKNKTNLLNDGWLAPFHIIFSMRFGLLGILMNIVNGANLDVSQTHQDLQLGNVRGIGACRKQNVSDTRNIPSGNVTVPANALVGRWLRSTRRVSSERSGSPKGRFR